MENTNNIFYIHENYFPSVEKKIMRTIKKCEKYGNDFTFEILGEEMHEDSRANHNDENNRYNGVFHKFIVIKVEGEAKVDNWEFVATLNIKNSGNVIRRCNTEIDIPDYYKTSPNLCDHCNTVRNRNNLYVIHNTVTGEFKQVGGDCLMSYSGISLDHAAALMDCIDHMYKYNDMYDYDFASGRTHYYSVNDVIRYASAIINKVGYFNVNSMLPTRWLVSDMLLSESMEKRIKELNRDLENNLFSITFSEDDFLKDNSSEVDAIIDYYMSLDDDSEFIHNIQTIISDGFATYADLGFLCYTPQGYAKHMQKEKERAARSVEKHSHWGEVGKRYKNVPVQNMYRVGSYVTAYGVMNVFKIVIENGIVLTWKTTSYPEDEISTVSFTIKEHGEYNGIPQTVVTRCMFAA